MTNKTMLMVTLALALAGCERFDSADDRANRVDRRYRAAMTDYAAGRLDESLKALEKIVADSPGNASARFQLACLQLDHARDYARAYVNFHEFLQQDPAGDKSAMARERLKRAECLLAPVLAKRYELTDNATVASENERLRGEVKRLNGELEATNAKVERALRRAEDYAKESERLRKLIAAEAAGEPAERPEAITDRALIDDEDESDGQSLDEELKRLRSECESEVTPFRPTAAAKPEKPAPSPAKLPAHPAVYEVQEGDTLIEIARRFYGVKSAWKRIRDANKALISTDGQVRAGDVITLPE